MHWCWNENGRVAYPGRMARWSLIGLLGLVGAAVCAQEILPDSGKARGRQTSAPPDSARASGLATAGIESFDGALLMGTPFRAFSQRSLPIAGVVMWTQLTPKPDDPLYGSHSIDVMVAMNGAIGRIDLEQFASEMGGNLSKMCDVSRRTLPMPVPLEGNASVVSCPTSSFLGGDTVALVLNFYGPRHLYSIQWKEWVRAPAQIDLNDPQWERRIKQILPLFFCAPMPDNPQTSDCVSPKQFRKTMSRPDSTPAAEKN